MKAKALLTAVLAVALSGCVLRGKPVKTAAVPATPKPAVTPPPAAPPPAPLSIPQTRVTLPAPQPLDSAAFDVEPIPEPQPVIPPPPRSRRASPPAATPPAVATPAPEPPRETVQEIVPTAELNHLKELVKSRRQEVNRILAQVGKRTPTKARQNAIATIKSFLTLSEEAESRNDMRQADGFVERAWILAKELQSGQ
jgi:hypothetical protein